MRLKPVIYQQHGGVSEAVMAQDKDKQPFASIFVKRITESDNKTQLMDEIFPKEEVRCTPCSERSSQNHQ